MSAVCRALGVSRSNLHARATAAMTGVTADEAERRPLTKGW